MKMNKAPDWLARMATDANREVAAAGPTAKRGRLSDRMWADVRVAARIARDEEVTVRVHGVLVGRPNRSLMKMHEHEVRQKPAAKAVAPTPPSAPPGDTSAAPRSKRRQRSARRLLEFQEAKRAAAAAESTPMDADGPHSKVRRLDLP